MLSKGYLQHYCKKYPATSFLISGIIFKIEAPRCKLRGMLEVFYACLCFDFYGIRQVNRMARQESYS
jgi:hypothetical protein